MDKKFTKTARRRQIPTSKTRKILRWYFGDRSVITGSTHNLDFHHLADVPRPSMWLDLVPIERDTNNELLQTRRLHSYLPPYLHPTHLLETARQWFFVKNEPGLASGCGRLALFNARVFLLPRLHHHLARTEAYTIALRAGALALRAARHRFVPDLVVRILREILELLEEMNTAVSPEVQQLLLHECEGLLIDMGMYREAELCMSIRTAPESATLALDVGNYCRRRFELRSIIHVPQQQSDIERQAMEEFQNIDPNFDAGIANATSIYHWSRWNKRSTRAAVVDVNAKMVGDVIANLIPASHPGSSIKYSLYESARPPSGVTAWNAAMAMLATVVANPDHRYAEALQYYGCQMLDMHGAVIPSPSIHGFKKIIGDSVRKRAKTPQLLMDVIDRSETLILSHTHQIRSLTLTILRKHVRAR